MVAELGQPALDGQKPADDDERHWSVTTILGCLKAEGLLYWTAEEAAKAAVNSAASLQARIEEEGREAVIKWLRDARFRRAKGERTAAELGTEVHAACEAYALTGQRPDVDAEVQPFLDQFDRWAQEFQPVYQAAEVTVYSPSYGYAGTCDAFLTVGGVRCIVDYKSSRKSFDNRGNPTTPYPEVALQLAAYRHAEMAAVWRPRRMEQYRRRYYLLGAAEREMAVPVPEVDTGLVIHITPDHCDAYPVECGPDIFESFLFVQEAARWQFQTSKTVIGRPLEPAKESAA
ncbi:MAG: hypothetical protein ACH36H_12630 [Candidatus Nanopelagicales bacterium]